MNDNSKWDKLKFIETPHTLFSVKNIYKRMKIQAMAYDTGHKMANIFETVNTKTQ